MRDPEEVAKIDGRPLRAQCDAKLEQWLTRSHQIDDIIRSWTRDLATYMRGRGLAPSTANWTALWQSMPDATVRALAQEEDAIAVAVKSLNEESDEMATTCADR